MPNDVSKINENPAVQRFLKETGYKEPLPAKPIEVEPEPEPSIQPSIQLPQENSRIADLENQVKFLERKLAFTMEGYEIRLRDGFAHFDARLVELEKSQPKKATDIPEDMTQLECQIFRNLEDAPDVIEPRYKGKRTEWSLHLTAWVGTSRCKPDFNVRLLSPIEFGKVVSEKVSMASEAMKHIAAQLLETKPDQYLAGVMLRNTKGKGRPYSSKDFVFVKDYNTDKPHVTIIANEKKFVFDKFKPGKGDLKNNPAKWYQKWTKKAAQ